LRVGKVAEHEELTEFAKVMRHELTLGQTIPPLLVASLGSVLVLTAPIVWREPFSAGILRAVVVIALISLAAALAFVVPVFAVLPRSRNPQAWVAILWGSLAACVTAGLVFGRQSSFRLPVLAGFALAGGLSGILYSLTAQWLERFRPTRREGGGE
jgi:hypothetical protein